VRDIYGEEAAMTNRTVKALLSVGLAGLVGCASGPQLLWSKPGAGQQDFSQDRYSCQRASMEAYSYNIQRDPACDQPSTGIGDSIAALGRICGGYGGSGTRVNEQLFQSCMEAQGWRLMPQQASDPNVGAQSTAQSQANTTDIKARAQKALTEFDRPTPKPYPCGSGWAASSTGYVVEVAEWADEAGLRLGDRIVAVGGTPVISQEERIRAYYQVSIGGPLVLGVTRQGQQITLSLPCRYQPERYEAARRTLEAASRGDWDGCITAASETGRLAGFIAYSTVFWEHECTRAKNPPMASPEGRNLVWLHYELTRVRLRESRYLPGGTENIRGGVLRIADDLRKAGFPTYADDLEAQLREALAARPVEPPASVPPR
jgi:hypothetical protein